VAFNVFKEHQERWLAACPGEDHYRRPGPIRIDGNDEDRPITLVLNALTAPPGA
jgi:pyrophosphate--fructose-6-phosphate 1-phosphotransferase